MAKSFGNVRAIWHIGLKIRSPGHDGMSKPPPESHHEHEDLRLRGLATNLRRMAPVNSAINLLGYRPIVLRSRSNRLPPLRSARSASADAEPETGARYFDSPFSAEEYSLRDPAGTGAADTDLFCKSRG